MDRKSFQAELETLINRHSIENGSDTPDFLLAEYLCDCLASYEVAVTKREVWYGRKTAPAPKGKPTIAELEAILASPDPVGIEIQPSGEIRAVPLPKTP